MTKQEIFIANAKGLHGDRYDYSKVVYTNSRSKVLIRCNKHNIEINQIASDHTRKTGNGGCPKCRIESLSNGQKVNTEHFISKARSKWRSTYCYNETNYTDAHSQVTVSCSLHGNFTIEARRHIDSSTVRGGCPSCGNSRKGGYSSSLLENLEFANKPCSIYLFICTDLNSVRFLKVGISQTIKDRTYDYVSNGLEPQLVKLHNTTVKLAYLKEQYILRELSSFKYYPHNDFGGKTECINISCLEQIVSMIP